MITVIMAAFALASFAQSSDQSYPTPVTTNEISGVIKARDIGDARLTSYFYTFSGEQGDIFVNVVSKNFNGDIDIFVAEGLKPLSKIVVFAESTESETGRVIYLRKPEKLILRIEGRSPNDDPANFKLKFAGSFVAAVDTGEQPPDLPEIKKQGKDSGVEVNSVGTIISVKPKTKPTPRPSQTVTAKTPENKEPEKKSDEDTASRSDASVTEKKADAGDTSTAEEPKKDVKKVEVIVSENIPESKTNPPPVTKPADTRTRRRRAVTPKKPAPAPADSTAETKQDSGEPPAKPPVSKPAGTARAVKPAEPDPMANINLVIVFKDGRLIEKPMTEVLRFTVDRGVLTVVSKDGTIGRYPIVDVLKTTIE